MGEADGEKEKGSVDDAKEKINPWNQVSARQVV